MGVLRPDPVSSQEPVALETTVIATGARPADATSKRELFTEETQTVLVFERGAVIRLSAAVVDGQLLFLTNKSTGKEVVTQVLRKRAFRPTNCYVDLEFTESCPGFWGIEFPKSAPDSGKTIAGKIKLGDENDGRANKPAAVPDAQDVERLRTEVVELQKQLKSLQQVAPQSEGSEPPNLPVPPPVVFTEQERQAEDKRLEALFAPETKLESAPAPNILVAHSPKFSNFESPKSSGKKWIAIAAVLLLAASAGAYRFGAFDGLLKKRAALKSVSTGAAASSAASSGKSDDARSGQGSSPENAKLVVTSPAGEPISAVENGAVTNNSVASNPISSNSAAKNPLPTNASPISDAAPDGESKIDASASRTAANSKVTIPAKSSGKPLLYSRVAAAAKVGNHSKSQLGPAATTSAPKTASNSVPPAPAPTAASANSTPDAPAEVSTAAESYVGPKLVKSVKPVAPPEALKNYVTGNVNVDALVDSNGQIQSVTVISGPPKLRATAIKEMKQYVYEPAKRNGKPVSSHVKVTLQYWYEP